MDKVLRIKGVELNQETGDRRQEKRTKKKEKCSPVTCRGV